MKIEKPKKSLRTILMLWFLMFSIVPLAFITGYSVVKYEQAINKEQEERLDGNRRELETILKEFEANLIDKISHHSRDNSLIYYLSQNMLTEARALSQRWLASHIAHRISVFGRDERLEISLYKDENGEIQRNKKIEGTNFYLPEGVASQLKNQNYAVLFDIRKGKSIDLIVFSKVQTVNGRIVGYIEEIIEIDKGFLAGLKHRMNLELIFFSDVSDPRVDKKKWPIIASHDDLELYHPNFFKEQLGKGSFELNIRDIAYGFSVNPITWGKHQFYIGIGASKKAVQAVLRNVNYAFYTVVGVIVFLLIILSFAISKLLLKPVSDLLETIKNTRPGEEIPEVITASDTELGVLAESFNEMSQRVNGAQKELHLKIKELESANQEIRETQAKLVHTAKMASLGQLVAGVAHELNNPIGFIYSNMGHLREYSDSLINLVTLAEKNPQQLSTKKKEVEFEYIVEDMPKLIKSCEDGARRTRDIVLGLRNFSRLEEAKLKEINIEESLDNTLNLLAGELKNRITVKKNFSNVPQILCYPSQLNQVFMNVLSNAAQAIKGKGEIHITTKQVKDIVEITITDTGKGMAEGTASQIFDPFFTTKTLGQGTGLGLSISYGIIQKHGGDIYVTSKLGAGTTFTLNLPIKGPTIDQ